MNLPHDPDRFHSTVLNLTVRLPSLPATDRPNKASNLPMIMKKAKTNRALLSGILLIVACARTLSADPANFPVLRVANSYLSSDQLTLTWTGGRPTYQLQRRSSFDDQWSMSMSRQQTRPQRYL